MSNQTPQATGSATAAPVTSDSVGATTRSVGRRRGDRFVGASEANQRSVEQAIAAARSKHVVLVQGPAGAGKTHVARAIHAWSSRADGPFVAFSADAAPAAEQARRLFGSEKEAGDLEAAAGGVLYVRDVETLDEGVLSALASTVRDGHFRHERGGDPIPFEVRLILGTTRGSDLRLAAFDAVTVALAPLSERREDIAPLAAHFLAQFAAEAGVSPVGFTTDARTWMLEESWTGNVRELRERIRQAINLAGGGAISAEALMLSVEGDEVPSFKEAKRAFETRYVEGLLRRCGGNISRAARLARKDRKDFYDVIRRTGVNPVDFRS